MHEVPHDGQPRGDATNVASLRRLWSRLAVAVFAGILVFYTTNLYYTEKAIVSIYHAPGIITNSSKAAASLAVEDRSDDDDELLAEEAVATAAAGNAPEASDGGGTQRVVWPAKKPNEGRTDGKGGEEAAIRIVYCPSSLYRHLFSPNHTGKSPPLRKGAAVYPLLT